jgi:hypothetical protein
MSAFSIVIGFSLMPAAGWACSVAKITSNVDLVRYADAVIRAKAVGYVRPPSNPNIWTTGVPDSKVRFEEMEVIRGVEASGLILPGYLVQKDADEEVDAVHARSSQYSFSWMMVAKWRLWTSLCKVPEHERQTLGMKSRNGVSGQCSSRRSARSW